MRTFFLTLFLAVGTWCHAQGTFVTEETKQREAAYAEEYSKYWNTDAVCDTLLLDDGTYAFLLRTPIRYIDGYTGLFKSGKEPQDNEKLLTEHSGLGARGYTITWRLKDKKLYIDRIGWQRVALTGIDKDGEVKPWQGPDVSLSEIKKRMELLTGKQFNAEGLLPADWVTDKVTIARYHPYRAENVFAPKVATQTEAFLAKNQETFELHFIKGELREAYKLVKAKL